jgi:Core-2/I-Branching enzyme
MKIAFLFLTYDNIEKEDIWSRYFSNIEENKYKIFIHPKNANAIYKQEFFKNHIIPEWCETTWGSFSLVEAQRLLIRRALKDKDITHLIILSYNTIPIQSFHKLFSYLNNKKTLIDYWEPKELEHKGRYFTLKNPIFNEKQFYVQSQWCILSRKTANIIAKEHKEIKGLFENSFIPDEHAYINYLIHYKNKRVEKKRIMYVIFKEGKPVVFDSLSKELLTDLKNQDVFFLRKVTNHTSVDVNYLLE